MNEKRFNLTHRLLHWAIAFTLLFLLLTILLRMGWMNMNHVGNIIQRNLDKSGTTISAKDAALIGKEVRRPMWNYHYLAGYTLIGLYLLRMILIASQGIAYKGPFSKGATLKDKFKGWVYIIFYCLLAISLFTGLLTLYGPKDWHNALSAIHTKGIYYLATFIILHLGGVLLAELGPEKGIISKMVSGDKKLE